MSEAVGTVFVEFVLEGKKFQSELKNLEGVVVSSGSRMEQTITSKLAPGLELITGKLKQLAIFAAAAFSVHKIIEFAKESAMLAVRVETLNISLHKIGENTGYTTAQIDSFVQGVKKQGITTIEASESVIKLAQANIDLTHASRLARIAQDAAVVGNMNSSEAFARMIHGIRTQQIEVLRYMGINIRLDQAMQKYAATLNKTSESLNQTERAQAIVNAVYEEGAKLAGIYEAAMTTAGKQMNSTKRYVDEIKESLGKAFGPAMAIIIKGFNDQLKELGKWLELPGTKEKIFEIAMTIKEVAGVVWSAAIKTIDAISKMASLLSELKNVVKGAAFAITTYFIASLIMSVTAMKGAEVVATGLIAKLATITIFLTRNPVGLAITAIGLAATSFFMLKENATSAADAMDLFKERAKTFTLDEAKAQVEALSKQLKEVEDQLKREKGGSLAPMLDVTKNYLKVEEIEKRRDILKEELGYVNARLIAATKLDDLEKKATLAVKADNERKIKEEEETKNKKTRAAQDFESRMAIEKSKSSDYFDMRQKRFEDEILLAREAGESEINIMQKQYDFAIETAKKQREQAAKEMGLTAKHREEIEQKAFNSVAFINKETQLMKDKQTAGERAADSDKLKSIISNHAKGLQDAAEYYKTLNEYSEESYDAEITLIEKKAKGLSDNFDKQAYIAAEVQKLDNNRLKTMLQAQLEFYGDDIKYAKKTLEIKKKLWALDADEQVKRSQGTLNAQEIIDKKTIEDAAKTTDKMGEIFKNAATGIQNSFTNLFENILDGGVNSFKKLGDSILALFKKILSQMLTLAIARPIMIPVVTSMGSIFGMETAASAVIKDMGVSGPIVSGGGVGAGATAGAGFAGAGFGSSVGGAIGNLQWGTSGVASRGIGYFFGEQAGQAAGLEIAKLSNSAFAGWAAGVSTFVYDLLSGKNLKESMVQATTTGLGAYGGAAIGTAILPGVGTAIGGVIGAFIGGKIGKIFGGGGEKKFTLVELIQPAVNDATFDALKGFESISYKHPYEDWYAPIANAYSGAIEIVQQSFNKMLFDFTTKLPEEMQNQIISELSKTDFAVIQAEISGGKWGISKAQDVIADIAKKYAETLSKTLADAYATALSDYILDKGAAGLVGDTAVWEVLADRVQQNINDMFMGIAEKVRGGGIEEGLKAVDEVNAIINRIGQAMTPIAEIIATKDMDDYELSLYNINKQFDAYAKTLKEAGVDLAKYTDLEEARSIAIDKLITQEEQLIDNLRGYTGTISQWLTDLSLGSSAPVSSMQSWVNEYTRRRDLAAGGEDVSGYLSYAKEFLTYMRAYGGDYKTIYETVVGDVATIGSNFEDIVNASDLQLQATKEADQAARDAAQAQLDATKAIAAAATTAAAIVAAEPEAATTAAAIVAGYDWTTFDWGSGTWGGGFASGGLAKSPSILGEAGPEWAVPTYEPQRTKFLKSAPKSFWSNLGQGNGGDSEITIKVPVYLDGNIIADATAKYVSRNSNLNEAIRRVI